MGKKDLANVTTDLSALASMMPTQRPTAAPTIVSAPPNPAAAEPAPKSVVPLRPRPAPK
jgi:hypothetical protein